jgi:hypothetical protein
LKGKTRVTSRQNSSKSLVPILAASTRTGWLDKRLPISTQSRHLTDMFFTDTLFDNTISV